MDYLYIVIGAVLLAAALFLIVAVLLQSGKGEGLSGSISGGSSETYFGKNKGKSRDKKLATLTIIVAIVFVLIVLAVFISQDYTSIWGNATTTGAATTTTGAVTTTAPVTTTGA